MKTKIIATLGPASSSYPIIRKMVTAGVDVVRLNFSHGSHAEHLGRIHVVRKINKKYRRHIRIMQDLEGFRIRIGHFKNNPQRIIKRREHIWLEAKEIQDSPDIIPIDYKHDLDIIPVGQFIYIDDGNLIIKVKNSSKKKLNCEVIEGGVLKERKGINVPGVHFPFSGLTHKDQTDINFGIHHRMDYIAQSFVRTKNDVKKVIRHVKQGLAGCKIIAKIETREAIKNIDDIIDIADGIMIARGDMGIAVPIYEIPMIQKMIIKKCNRKKKFVITATQMLEHMTEHSRPTRAEVTDVANAILDGTNYVMLSAETASGDYPVDSVKMMNQIIKFTETITRCFLYRTNP